MTWAVPAEEIDVWPADCVVCEHERGDPVFSHSREEAIAHRDLEHPWLATHLREDKEKTVAVNEYAKFWMVVRQHGPHGHSPTRRHASFGAALDEASRLAIKEGDVFYVLEAQTFAEPQAPPVRIGNVA